MEELLEVLMLFTIMNREVSKTMVMNYYRHIDRNRFQFHFMVHQQERGAYDHEIEAMGGNIVPDHRLYSVTFNTYRKQFSNFFDQHPEGSDYPWALFKMQFHPEARQRVPINAHAHNHLFDTKWLLHLSSMPFTLIQPKGSLTERSRPIVVENKLEEKKKKRANLQRNAMDTFLSI